MALAMKQKQSVNQKEWAGTFPTISTAVDSLLLVKHLTNLAIPTILFIRKILPDSEFDSKIFEGMTLKVLKKGTRNANSDRIQTWLAGAYDALEKKYLKSMSFEIKDTQSELSLEIYTINVTDIANHPSVSVSISPDQGTKISFREQQLNIQLQTVRLLQMLYSVMKSCSPLPPQVTIFMKLSYQENVPHDYHPFGYKPYAPTMPIFLKKTRTFEIGIVNTKHYVIEFMNKTCLCDESILPKTRKGKSTVEISKESESPSYFSNAKQGMTKSRCINSQNSSTSSQLTDPKTNKNDESCREISSQCTDDCSQSDLVRCPCLSKIKTSVMYQCSGCSYWVHAECFGIRIKNVLNAINIFYCQICHKLNRDYKCPDELMTKLKRAGDQQKLAVKRRLLSFCNRFEGHKVTFRKFEIVSGYGCKREILDKLLKDLISLGVLNQHESGGAYRIAKDRVVQVMPQFFSVGSISNSTVPVYETERKTPQLGKRKFENNDQSDKKADNALKGMPRRSTMRSLGKKYFR